MEILSTLFQNNSGAMKGNAHELVHMPRDSHVGFMPRGLTLVAMCHRICVPHELSADMTRSFYRSEHGLSALCTAYPRFFSAQLAAARAVSDAVSCPNHGEGHPFKLCIVFFTQHTQCIHFSAMGLSQIANYDTSLLHARFAAQPCQNSGAIDQRPKVPKCKFAF